MRWYDIFKGLSLKLVKKNLLFARKEQFLDLIFTLRLNKDKAKSTDSAPKWYMIAVKKLFKCHMQLHAIWQALVTTTHHSRLSTKKCLWVLSFANLWICSTIRPISRKRKREPRFVDVFFIPNGNYLIFERRQKICKCSRLRQGERKWDF